MNKIILVFITISSLFVYSQDDGKNIFNKLNESKAGNIKVYQSPKVRLAMENHLVSIEKKEGIDGYRVQIYSGNGKNASRETNRVRMQFISKYKKTKAHLEYKNPYFRVKVGNYRTKSEALFFLSQIKEDYPGAYIVKDIIDISVN